MTLPNEDQPAGLSALPDTLCSPNECPQCGETLIQTRGLEHYCEDCGYPDENRDSEPVSITYNQLNIQLREAGNAFVDMEPPAGYDLLSEDARSVADECMYAANAAMRTAMLRWHEDQTNL